MPIDAHSSEFTSLITAWLDETATAEQAAQLWQAVSECPECALEFAAATRFESLLTETVREKAGEKTALRKVVAGELKAPLPVQKRPFARLMGSTPLRMAAVLAVLALAAWLVLREEPAAPQVAQLTPPKPTAAATVSRMPSLSVKRPPLVSPPAPDAAASSEKPLLQRLDSFFLAGVKLDQVPLRDALGILQGQLKELNFLNAEILEKLRITLPTDAAGRRITFHSGPIAFLKAVRAVAALGGCEVTVDEPTLALILHREIYPQVPERRDLKNVLAGRVNADGSAAASDPKKLAALAADAASLGIKIDLSRPLDDQTLLPITRGQWTALQMLTDNREQLSLFSAPAFQLYISNGDANDPDEIIDEDKVVEMKSTYQKVGTLPLAVVTPVFTPLLTASGDQPETLPPITLQPLGEGTQVTLALNSTPVPGNDTVTLTTGTMTNGELRSISGLMVAGQGMSFNIDAANAKFLALSVDPGAVTLMSAAGNNINHIGWSGTIRFDLLPVTQPPVSSPPPPPP